MKKTAQRCCVVMIAVIGLAAGSGFAQPPPLEEELVNPSELVFQDGRPYFDTGNGYQALRTRQQGGETIYYRMVRYDPQQGYLAAGDTVPSQPTGLGGLQFGSDAGGLATPLRQQGAGHLYRPDFHNSYYNRDARQRYWGPGYFGSCSRYDGCREVQLLPVIP